MSASEAKRSLWSRMLSIFKVAKPKRELTGAHLRSLSPETAARLLGAGSMQPRAVTPAEPIAAALVGAPASRHEKAADVVVPLNQQLSSLPWPLLRTTGVFETEYAKMDRALAFSTADLVAQTQAQIINVADDVPVRATASARNLAGQLAVVARLNQPRGRAPNSAATKAKGISKAYAKSTTGKVAVHAAHVPAVKAGHDTFGRPQATVIDLAAIKKQRRTERSKRAA